MPLFVLACYDKPNALALRLATREAHLAHVRAHMEGLKVAGPLLDEAGEMAGSMFIFEAEDAASVRAFNAADPYQTAGLFERCELRGFRATLGQL